MPESIKTAEKKFQESVVQKAKTSSFRVRRRSEKAEAPPLSGRPESRKGVLIAPWARGEIALATSLGGYDDAVALSRPGEFKPYHLRLIAVSVEDEDGAGGGDDLMATESYFQ